MKTSVLFMEAMMIVGVLLGQVVIMIPLTGCTLVF